MITRARRIAAVKELARNGIGAMATGRRPGHPRSQASEGGTRRCNSPAVLLFAKWRIAEERLRRHLAHVSAADGDSRDIAEAVDGDALSPEMATSRESILSLLLFKKSILHRPCLTLRIGAARIIGLPC